jgi:transcription initiation factor TFIID subunit 1
MRKDNFPRFPSQSFIYRLFWESDERPRRVKMDELRRIFPNQEVTIRKNLKQCAEMRKFGAGMEFWVTSF